MRLLQSCDPALTCHFLERPFFWGHISLRKNIQQLRTLLAAEPEHTLIARGPISGYLARHAASNKTQEIIIQARGLLYEEYTMTHQHSGRLLRPFHAYRAWQYKKIEQHAYTLPSNYPVQVEAVTPALAQHLLTHYNIKSPLRIAQHDIPTALSAEERITARVHYRTLLKIDAHAPVYAYNGSFKPWQYADATFAYFKKQLQNNPNSVLLCISHDQHEARKKAYAYQVPDHAIRYLSVPHKDVIPLLCAADYGLLFREPHIVNWTSRPTKLLEYQSAGLTVIHNNTIDILQNDPTSLYAEPLERLKENE